VGVFRSRVEFADCVAREFCGIVRLFSFLRVAPLFAGVVVRCGYAHQELAFGGGGVSCSGTMQSRDDSLQLRFALVSSVVSSTLALRVICWDVGLAECWVIVCRVAY
jgi:hypothetical protein